MEEELRICTTCRWSRVAVYTDDTKGNLCVHPEVIRIDPKALASIIPGVRCVTERSKYYFGKCGIQGKLWEPI